MVSSLTDIAWLERLERLLTESTPAAAAGGLRLPKFRCRLDEQPHHLVPGHYLPDWPGESGAAAPLVMNPHACFTRDGKVPPHRPGIAPLLGDFALEGDLVWITEPGSGALQPFCLEHKLAHTLAAVRPGDPVPPNLPPEVRRVLTMADVLVPVDWAESRRRTWNAAVTHRRAQFQEEGYVPVTRLIHPFHVAELRRYYRYLLRTGGMRLGDKQCPGRHVVHNDGVARYFHHQLTAAVAALVGEPVKPSYVYVASYREGARLEKHTDREQCEFSITFCFDYAPEPPRATPWPLHLETPSAKVTVFQSLGDGLLYRGRELPHFRDPLPVGHSSASIFFHYVRESFAGSLD
jgi:hypothetical protein